MASDAEKRWNAYRTSQLHRTGSDRHLSEATKFSREGVLDLDNRKTRRTKTEKAEAKSLARRCEDGAFRVPLKFDDSDKSFAQKEWRRRAA